jgi:hypothetical protein
MAVGASTEVASARESAGSEGADSITLLAGLMAAVSVTVVALGLSSDSTVFMVVIRTTRTVVTPMTTTDAFTRMSESHLSQRV